MTNQTIKNLKNSPYVTWLFLGIQTIVFLLDTVLPEISFGYISASNLSSKGVMSGIFVVLNHEYWRFITPIFIHFGLMHFALNSVVLYYMGIQVEKIYGHSRFFIIYLFSGILGNSASFAFNPLGVISAGASTSLFGMFGAFVLLGVHFRDNPYVKAMSKQFLLFIILSFSFGMFDRSIDIWGHIGGLIGGVLIGNIVCLPKPVEKYSIHVRFLSLLVFVFFAIIFVMYGFKKYA